MKVFSIIFIFILCIVFVFCSGCVEDPTAASPTTTTSTAITTTTVQHSSVNDKITTKPTVSIPSKISPSTSSTSIIIPTTTVKQKDSASIHQSVAAATSSIDISGDISATLNPDKNVIGYISIPLTLADTSNNIDISHASVQFQYLNNEVSDDTIKSLLKPEQTISPISGQISEQYVGALSSGNTIMNSPKWGVLSKTGINSDDVLENGEQFTLGVGIPTTIVPINHFIVLISPPSGRSIKLDIITPTNTGNMNKLDYSRI